MTEEAAGVDVWPDYFPADCPPKEAGSAVGTFYRFTKKKDGNEKDLLCNWHRYEKHRATWLAEGRACLACGVSVYLTIDAARRQRGILPALRKSHLQSVIVVKPDGKLLHTPTSDLDPDHHTWWPQSAIANQLGALVHVEAPSAT